MSGAILIIQTAFAGDLILTTPLIQEAARVHPGVPIDVLCIPSTAALLANHPGVRRCIVYDKRKGNPKLLVLLRALARERYALCLCPHRSFRSAVLARATRAPRRICFDRSAAPWLFTETVPYAASLHEVDRNRSLLTGGRMPVPAVLPPRLFPSTSDRDSVAALLRRYAPGGEYICIAPGSVWATKRWTEEGFAQLARHFAFTHTVFLVGGEEDRALCARIAAHSDAAHSDAAHSGSSSEDTPAGSRRIVNLAGELGFLAAAALIEGASVLVSNDSAPVHLASAMAAPVVEIYGATVPAFGFSPYDVPHRIVQREDLDCRPCAIHGGAKCPIRTFACMRGLEAGRVIEAAEELKRERVRDGRTR